MILVMFKELDDLGDFKDLDDFGEDLEELNDFWD